MHSHNKLLKQLLGIALYEYIILPYCKLKAFSLNND